MKFNLTQGRDELFQLPTKKDTRPTTTSGEPLFSFNQH